MITFMSFMASNRLRLCCWALVNIAAVPGESCRCMDSSMHEFPVASDSEQPAASCFWACGVPYANLLPWRPTSQITLITLSLEAWFHEHMNSEASILLGQSSGFKSKVPKSTNKSSGRMTNRSLRCPLYKYGSGGEPETCGSSTKGCRFLFWANKKLKLSLASSETITTRGIRISGSCLPMLHWGRNVPWGKECVGNSLDLIVFWRLTVGHR